METLIVDNQEQLDNLIKSCSAYVNIYYNEEYNYIPINWDVELVKFTKINNHETLERILKN